MRKSAALVKVRLNDLFAAKNTIYAIIDDTQHRTFADSGPPGHRGLPLVFANDGPV
jgi:hypothetical protein